MSEQLTERAETRPGRPAPGVRRRRGRRRAPALAALVLGGAGVVAAPGAAHAAPACAAGWEAYEGNWHLEGGFPGRWAVTCDANGVADWVWTTPFGGGQHYRQNVFWGMPYLERWRPDGTSVVWMISGDPNQMTLSDETSPGVFQTTYFYRG